MWSSNAAVREAGGKKSASTVARVRTMDPTTIADAAGMDTECCKLMAWGNVAEMAIFNAVSQGASP